MEAWMERRWLQIALAVVLLLTLAPTPRPASLVVAARQGATAFSAGQPETALQQFEETLALEPGWTPLRQLAARAAIAAGDSEAAKKHIALLPVSSREDSTLRCFEALESLSADPGTQGTSSDLQLYLGCPNSSSTLERLAAQWMAAGQVEPTEALARAWAEAAPNEATPWSLLGRSVAVGSPAEAVPALERSIALDPVAGRSLLPLLAAVRMPESLAAGVAEVGRVYLQQEEWALAQVALEAAVQLAPEQARPRAYLGLARERMGGDGLQDVTAALAMQPDDPAILALHASLLRTRGRLEEAVAELLAAARLEPSDPAVAAELGAAYSALGDLPSATAAYKQAAQLTPDRPEFWLLLARFSADNAVDLQGLGLPAARNAIVLQERDASAWQALGQIHLLLGNQVLAERSLRRALSLDPRMPEAWYDLGLLRLAVQDRIGAQAALRVVLALDPAGATADLAQRALLHASPP